MLTIYRRQQETILQGHRFILSNMILTLHKVLTNPRPTTSNSSINDPIPALSSLTPLDPSSGYILEAKVRVSETSPNLTDAAEKELVAFADRMKGVIEMVVPERLSLDTRYLAQRPRVGVKPKPREPQGGAVRAQGAAGVS
jgi:mediator of RNA polymerase II transcription subunit 18